MESRYARKDSNQKFLSSSLNIRKMYDLYVKECQQKGKWAVKHHKYREIFCNEYNLSFHVPKKVSSFTSLVLDGTVSSLFPLQSIVHSFNANTKGCNKKLLTNTDRLSIQSKFVSSPKGTSVLIAMTITRKRKPEHWTLKMKRIIRIIWSVNKEDVKRNRKTKRMHRNISYPYSYIWSWCLTARFPFCWLSFTYKSYILRIFKLLLRNFQLDSFLA
jgi:hypothetical protein